MATRSRPDPRALGQAQEAPPQIAAGRAFRDGLLVNLTNPKVILFVLAFIPQFVNPAQPVLPQFLIFGAVLGLGGFVINGAVGLFAGTAGRRLTGNPGAVRWLNRVSGGTAPYVLGSVEQLEQPDQSYDIVIAMRMMAHVADWELFLASACRVARKAVIVDFPLASGIHRLYPLLFGLKKAIETDTRTYTRLPHKAVATAFRDNGFDPDAHVGQFVVPMAFHRFIKNVPISRASEAIFSPFASRMGNPVIIRAQRLPK